MKRHKRDCGTPEHSMHRRLFLQGSMAASTASVASFNGLFSIPALAEQVQQKQKKVILLWLAEPQANSKHGIPSQELRRAPPLELSKLNSGVMLGEMMPKTASLLDKTAIIRSMSQAPKLPSRCRLPHRGDTPRPPFTDLSWALSSPNNCTDSPVPQFV